MAEYTGMRQTGEPIVVCESPDVCLTPPGVPVPYSIVSYFDRSQYVTPSVLFTEDPAFTVVSSIPGVVGDEAGSMGGVGTGTHGGSGWTHVVRGSHSPNVCAEGDLIVFHTSEMEMNCPSPLGPGNTTGRCLWQRVVRDTRIEQRSLGGDPDAEPETEPELDQRLDEQNPSAETEWSLSGGREHAEGFSAGPFDDASTNTGFGLERSSVTERNFLEFGDADNGMQIGRSEYGGAIGAGYQDGNAYGRISGNVGFEGISGQRTFGDPTSQVRLSGEAYSAEARGQAEVIAGADGLGVAGEGAVEAILARGGVEASRTLTLQDMFDATANNWFGTDVQLPEAIGQSGVVIEAEVEAQLGAGVQGEFEAMANERGVRIGLGAGAALGPGLRARGAVGLQFGPGLVEGAQGMFNDAKAWVGSWFQ